MVIPGTLPMAAAGNIDGQIDANFLESADDVREANKNGANRTAADPSSTDQPPSQGSSGFGVAGAVLGIALVLMARRN